MFRKTGIKVYKPETIVNLNEFGRATIFQELSVFENKIWYHKLIMRSLNAFTMTKMLRSMYLFRPIRTIFWACINLPLTAINYTNYRGFSRHVKKIELQDNGR